MQYGTNLVVRLKNQGVNVAEISPFFRGQIVHLTDFFPFFFVDQKRVFVVQCIGLGKWVFNLKLMKMSV